MDLLSVPWPLQHVPSHPPGSLRNPHIELIITSQPLPSLITHILKLVEQSILHWMQIAVAEQSPQPLKVLSFSVFVLKKYRPARRLRSTSLCPVDPRHNCIIPRCCSNTCADDCAQGQRTRKHTQLIKPLSLFFFYPISSKLN